MTSANAYLICSDLMWISRVTGVAKDLGRRIVAVRHLETWEARLAQEPAALVIIDLDMGPATRISDVLRRAGNPPCRMVAFGSHVATAELAAARDAGCDPVLPRSAMAAHLPDLLTQWLSVAQASP